MADQEVLFAPAANVRFNPEAEGLWKRVLEDDGLHIKLGAWNRARAEGSFVGTCRRCGGHLRPEPTDVPGPDDDMSTIAEWLQATCVRCGHEFVAPDGKVLQRSAFHSRMPRTFIRNRAGVLDKPRADP